MKRSLPVLIMFVLILTFSACGESNSNSQQKQTDNSAVQTATATNVDQPSSTPQPPKQEEIVIKSAPDKYTAYIKNYVNRNCASIGYQSLGGDRMDQIGNGYLKLIMIDTEGTFFDTDDESLKEYSVVSQSYAPNTEIKFTYQKDSNGEEYSNLVEWQSIDEIVLRVKHVGTEAIANDIGMTEIKPSTDKYTAYIKDYSGRNLLNCGYISLGNDLRDEYGAGNVAFVIIAEDGSYVEIDEETLKNYYVVGQSPSPNTEIKLEFEKDSNGNEYNFTNWQSTEEIELYVKKLANSIKQKTQEPSDDDKTLSSDSDVPEDALAVSDSEIRPDIKEAIDSYEAFIDEYCAFMEDYNMTDLSQLAKYGTLLSKELEMSEKFNAIQDEDLTSAESIYYSEVILRCAQKMLSVANKIN